MRDRYLIGILRALGALAVVMVAAACSGPTDVSVDLPDGEYTVVTSEPRIIDEFATPSWMREMPTIEFRKDGDSFFVTASSDDLVVEGSPQLAIDEGGFWRVHFGWAPDEEHHYWEILMTLDECAAAAVDADLGIPPNGALTVILEECTIQSR